MSSEAIPLVTDLDGTLIYSDLSIVSGFKLIRKKPYYLLLLPFIKLIGKHFFKRKAAACTSINIPALPYISATLHLLKEAKSQGRPLVLATASLTEYGESVQAHLGIFDYVFGSDKHINLRSHNKLAKLEETFGKGNFDYIGDSMADIAVWAGCRKGYAVNPSPQVLDIIKDMPHVSIISKEKELTLGKLYRDSLRY